MSSCESMLKLCYTDDMSFTTWITANKNQQGFAGLWRWNRNLAILHALQAVLILILANGKTFAVTLNYVALDPLASHGGQPALVPASQHWLDVNLAYLVAAFFLMSALAHLLMATVYRSTYETDLRRGMNRIRWIEYAMSASTMMVAIGLLVGVVDFASLLMLFGLTAVMNLLGLAMEVYSQGTHKPSWLAYIIGCVAGAIPWLVIVIYLLAGGVYGSTAPAFVYWIFVSIFLFFSCFAVNMFLQYRQRGHWANYLYGERVYMILSLVAKTALAWQIFSGTLRP